MDYLKPKVRENVAVAALLLANLPATAVAADNSGHPSKNAQKVVATLNMLGINSPEIKEFVDELNTHVKNGYFNLTEEQALGGTFSLRYPLNASGEPHRLQLNYSPEDMPHWNVTARRDSVMITYKLKFD